MAVSEDTVKLISESIFHRGPDDGGAWIHPSENIGFVHQRLSIIDLSSGGHQPKTLTDNSLTIAFNGEIYNYKAIQEELTALGIRFDSESDTEVLLKGWQQWGKDVIPKLKGMYAFAIWDNTEGQLFLVRDPLGIKPLYYSAKDNTVCFSSELQTFKSFQPGLQPDLNGLSLYARFGSIPAPFSALQNIALLPPGSCVTFSKIGATKGPEQFWHFKDCFDSPPEHVTTYSDAVAYTRKAILESIERHMVADVPIGVFLSGGIDSAAIVSLMRQSGATEIKSFSLGFEDPQWDESQLAKHTAEHYKTDHYEWRVTQEEFRSLRDEYLQHAHFSIDGFNTWLVSKFAAKSGMKVVLSGLGGDELFHGYETSFFTIPQLWSRCKVWPLSFRKLVSKMLSLVPTANTRRKEKANQLLNARDLQECYLLFRQVHHPVEGLKLAGLELPREQPHAKNFLPTENALNHLADQQKISVYEVYRFMISQLLLDSDRYSMAHGLELRVPFVDKVLYESIAKLPAHVLAPRHGINKCLLVDAVGDIPQAISHREKSGFRLPMEEWLEISPSTAETWEQHWAQIICKQALKNHIGYSHEN